MQDHERQQERQLEPQLVEPGFEHVRTASIMLPPPHPTNDLQSRLYIDQPVGVGFSYGTTDVGTSQAAAEDIWTFLQIFFKDTRFAKYQKNDFALWTESYVLSASFFIQHSLREVYCCRYGGHYGPTFAA